MIWDLKGSNNIITVFILASCNATRILRFITKQMSTVISDCGYSYRVPNKKRVSMEFDE
jgi:hypothetical protein